jgi:hypothetical protein
MELNEEKRSWGRNGMDFISDLNKCNRSLYFFEEEA